MPFAQAESLPSLLGATSGRHFPDAPAPVQSDDPRERLSGASRDRTGDLLLAKQALSQLSYGPVGGRL